MNSADKEGKTLLTRAILLNKAELIPDLLACGAAIEQLHEGSGATPLLLAVMAKNTSACEALIVAGANVDARNERGVPALAFAINQEMDAIVKLLLGRNAVCDEGCCAMLLNSEALLPHLIESKTPLPLDKMLWDAMYMRKLGLFTLLVESGADVNATGEEGRTLLQEASDRDDILFVQRLLRLGADVNRTNNAGDTALSLALSRGNKETAQLLLNKGAVVRQQDFMNFHAIFPPPRYRSR